MSVRIRYKKVNGSILRSAQFFPHATNGAKFVVELNGADNTFKVLDDVVNEVVAEGKSTSLHKLKIAAKDALTRLGISFVSETRAERVSSSQQVQ